MITDNLRLRATEQQRRFREHLARPGPCAEFLYRLVVDCDDHDIIGRFLDGGKANAQVIGLAIERVKPACFRNQQKQQGDNQSDEPVASDE